MMNYMYKKYAPIEFCVNKKHNNIFVYSLFFSTTTDNSLEVFLSSKYISKFKKSPTLISIKPF